jgi:hypothetical protein
MNVVPIVVTQLSTGDCCFIQFSIFSAVLEGRDRFAKNIAASIIALVCNSILQCSLNFAFELRASYFGIF